MKNTIEQILFEHSYEVHEEPDNLTIQDEDNKSIIAILYFISGLLLFALGWFISPFYAIWVNLLGLGLIFYAATKELSNTPREITFWKSKGKIELWYNILGRRYIAHDKIQEFFATGKKETNLSSPFRDGNKTFGYEIYVRLKSGKEKKLLSIDFHEEHEKDIQELTFALNSLTGTN